MTEIKVGVSNTDFPTQHFMDAADLKILQNP